jgi:hypothetical protein
MAVSVKEGFQMAYIIEASLIN